MGSVALHGVSSIQENTPVRYLSDTGIPQGRRAWNGQVAMDGGDSFRILFVTPEIADFVKVGGLGDVSSALPRALASRHDVRILIPAYREMIASDHEIEILGKLPGHADIPPCELGKTVCSDGLTVYLLVCPELFEREGSPYCDETGVGWEDNDIRFA
ncbi:glycogen/starch synthase, partial [Modicisalibacter luteus]